MKHLFFALLLFCSSALVAQENGANRVAARSEAEQRREVSRAVVGSCKVEAFQCNSQPDIYTVEVCDTIASKQFSDAPFAHSYNVASVRAATMTPAQNKTLNKVLKQVLHISIDNSVKFYFDVCASGKVKSFRVKMKTKTYRRVALCDLARVVEALDSVKVFYPWRKFYTANNEEYGYLVVWPIDNMIY